MSSVKSTFGANGEGRGVLGAIFLLMKLLTPH